MNKIDITSFIDAARRVVDNHYIGGGAYRRWLWQSPGGDRDLGANEYGCADAANILYSIDEFSIPREERDARLSVLLSMQNKESGMFVEATHHPIHTTAHCCGAIELFDTRPLYPRDKSYDKRRNARSYEKGCYPYQHRSRLCS